MIEITCKKCNNLHITEKLNSLECECGERLVKVKENIFSKKQTITGCTINNVNQIIN